MRGLNVSQPSSRVSRSGGSSALVAAAVEPATQTRKQSAGRQQSHRTGHAWGPCMVQTVRTCGWIKYEEAKTAKLSCDSPAGVLQPHLLCLLPAAV